MKDQETEESQASGGAMEHPKCKSCGSERCAEILYGRRAETKQLREDLKAGKVVLGGCFIVPGIPCWRCLDCGAEWGDAYERA
jgi:hypothetical protein